MGPATSLNPATALAVAVRTIASSYLEDTREPTTGRQALRERNKAAPASVRALEEDIAGLLHAVLGPRASRYKLCVSAGQPSRRYVLIPYATILRRDVTNTPRSGVYVALLFDQDCKHLWLTLNQGVFQFENRFGLQRSREHLRRAATIIGASLDAPAEFHRKSAQLGASTPYGQGYEQGSILCRRYDALGMTGEIAAALLSDMQALLDLYDRLPAYALRDPSAAAMEMAPTLDEDDYQKAVNLPIADLQSAEDRPRQLSRPSRSKKQVESWQRDVSVAREALMRANYECEARCSHERFNAASGKHFYSEAHHLIPIAKQAEFEFSLDVAANIVCLCPSCHAKVHRSHKQERDTLILQLFRNREARLVASGLHVTHTQLISMYSL